MFFSKESHEKWMRRLALVSVHNTINWWLIVSSSVSPGTYGHGIIPGRNDVIVVKPFTGRWNTQQNQGTPSSDPMTWKWAEPYVHPQSCYERVIIIYAVNVAVNWLTIFVEADIIRKMIEKHTYFEWSIKYYITNFSNKVYFI